MSYARWSETSSVYVYAHVGGFIDCCGCTHLHSIPETVAHMQEHRDKGDRVPDHLLDPATYDDQDFVAMCMTYMCFEYEGHEGEHTPLKRERDQQIRDNTEASKFVELLRGRRATT